MKLFRDEDEGGGIATWVVTAVAAAIVLLVAFFYFGGKAKADTITKGSPVPSVASVLSSAPLPSWTGPYVSGGFGYQMADTDLGVDVESGGFTGNLLGINSLSGNGWAYDGRVGFDWQIPNTGLVVGVFGGYGGGDTEFNVSSGLPGAGTLLTLNVRQDWYAGGRLGVVLGKAMVYGGYAFAKGQLDVGIPAAPGVCGAAPGLACSQDLDGRMWLAGVEIPLSPQVALGAEYKLTQYDTATIFSAGVPGNNISLNADADVHAVMGRVIWRPFAK